MKQVTSVGLSLFNYQDDARSNKHKIHIGLHLENEVVKTPIIILNNRVLGYFGGKKERIVFRSFEVWCWRRADRVRNEVL